MRSIASVLLICFATLFSACSYSSMPGNTSLAPTVTGRWSVTLAPTGQSGSVPAPTTFTVNFTQNGSSLSGTVTSVNNPDSTCFPLITSQSTFTVTGQAVAQSTSNSNLSLSIAFTSGSSSGTIMGTGALVYLGTMANGTFSFSGGAAGCSSGTFAMTQG